MPQSQVREPFKRLHHRVEPGPSLGVEDLDQIEPERLGDEQKRADVEGELKPGVEVVHDGDALEFFRAEHGGHEVDQAAERDQADDEVFHNAMIQRTFSQNIA